MDDRQAASFGAYLARMGIQGPGGERLTPEQAAELVQALAASRVPRADPDITGSPMFAAAVGFHEFFRVLTAAGFTEDQALRYMAYVSQAGNAGP